MAKGLILNIQRMSTEDGPGLRTTVFFKGCPLACKWCHNPESISFRKEHEWFSSKCIYCKTCEASCPNGAISFGEHGLIIDYGKCRRCMDCTIVCPTNALEAKGIEYTAQELFSELIKDRAYFGEAGGVTLSGGEALAQHQFVIELMDLLYTAGINIAVDTCGHVNLDWLRDTCEYSPLFLYDLKIIKSDVHKEYTGIDNKTIKDNFISLADIIRKDGKARIWVRTPLIPGTTDTIDNIDAIARFIADNAADVVERWELLEFNNLCASKYQRLNKVWDFGDEKKQSEQKLCEINDLLAKYEGIRDSTYVAGKKVYLEGMPRNEKDG